MAGHGDIRGLLPGDARRLRLLQAGAALLWIVYGVRIGAGPVIGANAAVAAIALASLRRLPGGSR